MQICVFANSPKTNDYENNNTTLFFGFWLLAFGLQAQDYQWQWAKNGGGSLKMQGESSGAMGNNFNFEHIRDIVTDQDNNYYFLGKIAHGDSHVDSNEVTTFGNGVQGNNIIITSFTCNGTYRWSRVIFGGGNRLSFSL